MTMTMTPNVTLGSLALPGASILGELAIVSIREQTAVPFPALADLWAAHGVPGVTVPKQGNAKDAFRKATPKGKREGRFYFMAYDGGASLPGMVDACILVESLDNMGRVDKFHKNLGVLMLNTHNEIEYHCAYYTTEEAGRFLTEMQETFERNLNFASARQVRAMVIRALELSSKVSYHDGVYLIPQPQLGNLERIAQFVTALDAYAPVPQKLIRIPYLDTPETRADLKQMLAIEIETNVERILAEADEFVRTRKDPHKVTAAGNKGLTLLQELTYLGGRIADYEATLNEAQLKLQVYLGAKQQLVRQLLGVPQP